MDASAVEMERLELRTQATPAAVPGVRRAVVDFAELHGVGVGPDVALAVSEAITNAVLHAYREEQAGPVRGGAGAKRHAAADPPPAQADPPAAASCPQGGTSDVDGGHLRMPVAARPASTPLIVVLVPGGRGDRSDRLGVGAAATRQGFAVLYPTSDDTFWALNHDQGDADVDAV